MNYDHLKIFLAVVDSKSFTKAAEALYISHSTTSRSVSALEAELGVRLLNRDSRFVSPTDAGQLLYAEGVRLMRQTEAIENAVRSAGRGSAGRIDLVTVNLFSYELHNGYRDFCRKYPDVLMGMYHRGIGEIVPHVISGQADVGVTFSYALPDDTSGMAVYTVSKERFCVMAPVEYPIAMRKSVRLSDLSGLKYLTVPAIGFEFIKNPSERDLFMRTFSDLSIVPSMESLMLQIRSGNGISMVPYPIAYEYGSSCAILDIEDLDTSFDVVMIWLTDNTNPTLPLFVSELTEKLPGRNS